MFVWYMAHELWVLIYDAEEMKFTIVWNGLLLCSHKDIQGTHYTLNDSLVHVEQTEPNPIFIACFSCEL